MPPSVLFLYGWDLPFIDAVTVRGEDNATAYRSRSDDNESDIFAPGNIVWKLDGSVVEAVDELLRLARPGETGAPTLIIPTPSSLWVPSAGG
jgi:hypothetical protein